VRSKLEEAEEFGSTVGSGGSMSTGSELGRRLGSIAA